MARGIAAIDELVPDNRRTAIAKRRKKKSLVEDMASLLMI